MPGHQGHPVSIATFVLLLNCAPLSVPSSTPFHDTFVALEELPTYHDEFHCFCAFPLVPISSYVFQFRVGLHGVHINVICIAAFLSLFIMIYHNYIYDTYICVTPIYYDTCICVRRG